MISPIFYTRNAKGGISIKQNMKAKSINVTRETRRGDGVISTYQIGC